MREIAPAKEAKEPKEPKVPTVIVADAVSDGVGGFYPVGTVIDVEAETLASLIAKRLVAVK